MLVIEIMGTRNVLHGRILGMSYTLYCHVCLLSCLNNLYQAHSFPFGEGHKRLRLVNNFRRCIPHKWWGIIWSFQKGFFLSLWLILLLFEIGLSLRIVKGRFGHWLWWLELLFWMSTGATCCFIDRFRSCLPGREAWLRVSYCRLSHLY
jgi:hypothetical protein